MLLNKHLMFVVMYISHFRIIPIVEFIFLFFYLLEFPNRSFCLLFILIRHISWINFKLYSK